jgi:hypothetical protein
LPPFEDFRQFNGYDAIRRHRNLIGGTVSQIQELDDMVLRILTIAVLSLLATISAVSQDFRPKGQIKIEDAGDQIVAERLLPGENRLLLVRRNNIQVWDSATTTLVASRPIDVPDMTEDDPRLISPSGRFMFVFGNYKSGAKQDKIKR